MRFSASALPLLVQCAHSARPGTWLAADKKNPAASVGDAVHLLSEWHLTGKPTDVAQACVFESVRPADIDRVGRLWGELQPWLRDKIRDEGIAEEACGYAPETGLARVLGHCIGRKYREHGQRDNELAGTADIVLVGEDSVTVLDLKTGRSAAESYRWQLRMLGLAAARAHGKGRCTIGIVRVSEVEIDDSWTEELDASDLEDVAAEVLRVWGEAPTAKPKPGLHCEENYCRARQRCDAYRTWRAA